MPKKIISVLFYKAPFGCYLGHHTSRNHSHLRCLEFLSKENECSVIFHSKDSIDRKISQVNGVTKFIMEMAATEHDTVSLINEINPDVILINDPINDRMGSLLARLLPTIKIIARCHSELHAGGWFQRKNCPLISDIIVPLDSNVSLVSDLKIKTHVIPFYSDDKEFVIDKYPRDIDFISSCRSDPITKQREVVDRVFDELRRRGYRCENVVDVSFSDLKYKFLHGKVFFYPSLIEASGSRVLFEAIYAGMQPIVDIRSKSCREMGLKLGFVDFIDSGVTNYSWHDIKRQGPIPVKEIADNLQLILQTKTFPISFPTETFSYDVEIKLLAEVLSS